MTNDKTYPRDLAGYANHPPRVIWPNNAKIAVQFVLNIEEGAENCILHGDAASETFLSEIIGAQAFNARHMSMESIYEYGARAGVWRILAEFEKRKLPMTVFGVAMALVRNPEIVAALRNSPHEVACHGLRWISYQSVAEDVEREHMRAATAILSELFGKPPLGWYTGRDSPNTGRLLAEQGGYLYSADSYADDLPYYVLQKNSPQLIVPYTLDANDMRFASPQGFNTATHFYEYLRDSFDALYAEGESAPKMLSIGMHARILGRPGRIVALQKFLDYVQKHNRVWVCTRADIAQHWLKHHPYEAAV
jgi:allantoinase